MTDVGTTVALDECDIIMKGGITSGIVYPGAVVALAEKYTFRQIGGASAGAIAATMAAAAEVGRRNETEDDPGASFRKLGKVPEDLGQDLATLFQPSPSTEVAFDALMAAIEPEASKFRKLRAIVSLIVRHSFGWFLVATLLAMIPAAIFDLVLLGLPDDGSDWIGLAIALLIWVPVAVAIGVLIAAVKLLRAANAAVGANGFGLCDGHTHRAGVDHLPLTDWMEQTLRDLAGVPSSATRPVCFGDLWGPVATQEYRDAFTSTPRDGGDPVVHLEDGEAARLRPSKRRQLRAQRITDCLVMTTNLSHRRPYRFPFDTQEFFWCERCLGDYFPANVVAQMKATARPVGPMDVGSKDTPITIATNCARHSDQPLYLMPLAPDIPVVIAARISLSFPALISAIPFYAIDWTRAEEQRGVVTVWFSDGGIASNFPMRFFDAVWPKRPTFGINLAGQHPDHSQMVWRPKPGASGRLPRYVAMSSLGGFFASILDTMQNWSDSTQITMPGFRDRVVEVRQYANEGGMNLRMPPDVIRGLARRGADAGRNITSGDEQTPAFDFDTHRWIRHRVAMASIDDVLTAMVDVWPEQQTFLDTPHDGFEAGSNDRVATGKVIELAEELGRLRHPATLGTVPRPQPDLRLSPPL